MEIGPIPGIRAVPALQSTRAASDLSAVFRVEFRREQQESYTPTRQSAERGLEEEDESAQQQEDAEPEQDDAADSALPLQARSGSGHSGEISFFA